MLANVRVGLRYVVVAALWALFGLVARLAEPLGRIRRACGGGAHSKLRHRRFKL